MRTIILYGELAKRFGKTHRLAVKTVAEAIRALKANYRGFESYMCTAHQGGVQFRVYVGSTRLNEAKEIKNPSGDSETIRFVPVLVGSKDGFFGVLVGALLIATAIIAAPFTAGTSLSFIPGSLATLGASMIIGGVARMIAGDPQNPERKEAERKQSYLFSGPENVTAQGRPIPVGYGRMIVGSTVISAGIETHDE